MEASEAQERNREAPLCPLAAFPSFVMFAPVSGYTHGMVPYLCIPLIPSYPSTIAPVDPYEARLRAARERNNRKRAPCTLAENPPAVLRRRISQDNHQPLGREIQRINQNETPVITHERVVDRAQLEQTEFRLAQFRSRATGMFTVSQRHLMADLVKLGVPAEKVGLVMKRVLRLQLAGRLDVVDPPNAVTVRRAVLEIGCVIEYDVARHLCYSKDIWCGIDSTGHAKGRKLTEIQLGGRIRQSAKEWEVTIKIAELTEHSAKAQAKAIRSSFEVVQQKQRIQGLTITPFYAIRSIIFDNASENRGHLSGLYVQLNEMRQLEAQAEGKTCEDMLEKGCSDHIVSLVFKDWSNQLYQYLNRWGKTSLIRPENKAWKNGWAYLMFRISKRWGTGTYRASFAAYCKEQFGRTVTIPPVNTIRYASAEVLARLVLANYPMFKGWYEAMWNKLTEKDKLDYSLLVEPDIQLMLVIATIGFDCFLGPLMSALPGLNESKAYCSFIQPFASTVVTLLTSSQSRLQHLLSMDSNPQRSKLALAAHDENSTQSIQKPSISALTELEGVQLGPLKPTPEWLARVKAELHSGLSAPDSLYDRAHLYLAELARSICKKLLQHDAKFLKDGIVDQLPESVYMKTSNRSGERALGIVKSLLNTKSIHTRAVLMSALVQMRSWELEEAIVYEIYRKFPIPREARRREREQPSHAKMALSQLRILAEEGLKERARVERKETKQAEGEWLSSLYKLHHFPEPERPNTVDAIQEFVRFLKENDKEGLFNHLRIALTREKLIHQLRLLPVPNFPQIEEPNDEEEEEGERVVNI